MLISFIIAAYNAEQYLLRCIESCLRINCEKEIIIVNDGSTDGTLSVVEKLINQYPSKIKLINQPNRGVSAARNAGIKASCGEWLLFVDADDTIDGDALCKILFNPLVTSNKIEICTFSCNFIFKEKTEIHHVENKIYDIDKFINSALFQLATWNYIFKRNLILENNIYFPEGIICTEDQNFNLKALSCCDKIISFNNIVYNYNCTNQNSASKKVHSPEWIKSRLRSANDLLSFCKGRSIPLETVFNQIKRLYESYMNDNTTNIHFDSKKSFFIQEYRKTLTMMPSFRGVKKFYLCSISFELGSLLFYLHKKYINYRS